MEELDNNVFIKKWYSHIDKFVDLYKEYLIYYIDGSKRKVAFTKESTEEEIKPQLLHLIDRDLKEKGWIKEEKIEEPKHNPAEDPYYQQEWLYIPNDINCGS